MKTKPYVYDTIILPHDANNGSLTGATVAQTFREHGFRKQKVLTAIPVDDARINTVRNFLPRCWFNAANCVRGLDALRSYHKEWDEKLRMWKARPKHDWSSHSADAFLHLAIAMRNAERQSVNAFFARNYTPTADGGSVSLFGG